MATPKPIKIDGSPLDCTITILRPLPLAFTSSLHKPRVPKERPNSTPKFDVALEFDTSSDVYGLVRATLLKCAQTQYEAYKASKGSAAKKFDADAMPLFPRKDRDGNVDEAKAILRASTSALVGGEPRTVPIRAAGSGELITLDGELGANSLVCLKFRPKIYGDQGATTAARAIGMSCYLEGLVLVTRTQPMAGGGFAVGELSELQLDGIDLGSTPADGGGANEAPAESDPWATGDAPADGGEAPAAEPAESQPDAPWGGADEVDPFAS